MVIWKTYLGKNICQPFVSNLQPSTHSPDRSESCRHQCELFEQKHVGKLSSTYRYIDYLMYGQDFCQFLGPKTTKKLTNFVGDSVN